MPTSVFVSIYIPSDERDPSHWAIYLKNSTVGDVILQVSDDKGGVGYYVEEPMYSKQPERSARHDISIKVGTIASRYHDVAVTTIQATPVDNDSGTWNCQAWVMEALDSLEDANLFTWDRREKQRVQGMRQHWQ